MREPVAARRRAIAPLELSREVTLVGEPGSSGDCREAFLRAGKLRGGPLEPKATAILADALPVVGAEGAGEVGRVKADLASDLR